MLNRKILQSFRETVSKKPLTSVLSSFLLGSGLMGASHLRNFNKIKNNAPLSRSDQMIVAGVTGKVNSPTLAYQTVYGKNPDKFLMGRTNEPKKKWKGIFVDKGLKNKWLDRLNKLPVEIRSSEEGKGPERPAAIVFRMPPQYDKLHKKIVNELQKEPNIYAKSDIGFNGRPRICVAGKIWKGNKKWNNWWESLPEIINKSYNTIIKDE